MYCNILQGERIVTTLVPHPPSVSNSGLVKEALTDCLIIEWLPPKGGFTKYVLGVCRITLDNELDEDGMLEQDISFLLTSHTIHGLKAGNKLFSIYSSGKINQFSSRLIGVKTSN